MDIDLLQSEKKTLVGFLSLYSILCVVILFFIGFLYFSLQKDLMLNNKRVQLQEYSNDLIYRLKDLHINFDKYKFYPRDERFNSAIYDSDRKLIFSTLQSPKVNLDDVVYTSKNYIHFIEEPDSYYLGAKYVILEVNDDQTWLTVLQKEIALFVSIGFMILFVVGFFLLRLFLKPMRDAFHLLDRFIKDTTHELNTPISAIVANIELIDFESLEDEKLKKKIRRIDIGAKTVSNIYQDLTYLTLNNKIVSQNERLDLSRLLVQRVEYFKILADVKKIDFHVEVERDVELFIDRTKISKVVDNLISNAIKYNKVDGSIFVRLKMGTLIVEDSGRGIAKDKIDSMFERYSRFDKSVGGFGIGLNIVSMICQEYNLNIKIESELHKGTKVILTW